MKLKKGDKVKVIAGKYKNSIGNIKQIFPKENRIIIENLVKLKKHTKPNNLNPDGGIVEKDGSIHASNVMIFSAKSKQKKSFVSKIGYQIVNDKKVRIFRKTKKVIKKG